MKKPKMIPREKAADRPAGSTHVSRKVLFALRGLGSSDLKGILEALKMHKGVTRGTIWTILERARLNGLVERNRSNGAVTYTMTAGGTRRVKWIEEHPEGSEV